MKRILYVLMTAIIIATVLCASGCIKTDNPDVSDKTIDRYNPDEGINREKKLADIINGGMSNYIIVYGGESTECEQYAASELSKYFYNITGVSVPVKDERALVGSKKIISIGQTDALVKSGLEIDYGSLNGGFVLKTLDKDLYIVGEFDYGTLYGVYDFIEKICGVRFFSDDFELVPKSDFVPLYEMNVTEIPSFKYRVHLSASVYYADGNEFTAKSRFMHEFNEIADKYGGSIKINRDINPVHNNLTYVPVSEYYTTAAQKAENAHMYYLSNDKPIDICYSDGIAHDGSIDNSVDLSAAKVYLESLKKYILQNPDAEYYPVGQEDIRTMCSCEKCSEEVKRFGATTAVVLRFYNAVAKEIQIWADTQPQLNGKVVKLVCFAYLFTAEAPVVLDVESGAYKPVDESLYLADNLVLRIADLFSNRYFSLLDPRSSTALYGPDYFKKWESIMNDSWYWGYLCEHSYYAGYYPNLQKSKTTLLALEELGTEYVLLQNNNSERQDWKTIMENYIYSKMLWNPHRDINALREEFIENYFDIVSEEIKSIVTTLDEWIGDIVLNKDKNFLNTPLSTKHMPAQLFEGILSTLDTAQTNINASSVLSDIEKQTLTIRVKRVRLSPLFYLMWNRTYYYSDDAQRFNDVAKEYFTLCDELGVRQYGELDRYISNLKTQFPYNS